MQARDPIKFHKHISKDIEELLLQYPKFFIEKTEPHLTLVGEIEFLNDKNIVEESVQVRLVYNPGFPSRYPKVFEIGCKFPEDKHELLHINSDKSLCIDVLQQEFINIAEGLNKSTLFIKNKLPKALGWRIAKLNNFHGCKQEFSHELLGNIEWYKSVLKINDYEIIYNILKNYLYRHIPKRRSNCICGKEKRFKNCHEYIIEIFAKLPENQIISDLKLFQNNEGHNR
jgi:hypothetical protein